MPLGGTTQGEMHIPLLGGVQGWVESEPERPTRKADAFCPSREGIFRMRSRRQGRIALARRDHLLAFRRRTGMSTA